MARLLVRKNGQTLKTLLLEDQKTYVAGRKEDCDILLPGEKSISREHFKVYQVDGQWTIELVSKFGEILHQGENVQVLTLEDSSTFTAPPFEFQFFILDQAEVPALVTNSGAATTSTESVEVDEKTFVGKVDQVAFIKIVGRDGEVKEQFRLDAGQSWLAGREESCAIHIKDPRVSRKQFEIRKAGNEYTIIDLGSVNGTLVNGNTISSKKPVRLKSGDAITVIDNVMYFELRDQNFNELVQSVDYEKISRALVTTSNQEVSPWAAQQGSAALSLYQQPQMDPYAQPYPLPLPQMSEPQDLKDKIKSFDFRKNWLKLLIAVLAVATLVGLLMDNLSSAPPPSQGANSLDPFNKLKKEQQTLIKESLQLAKEYYNTQNPQMAVTEINKIKDIFPEYKNSTLGKDIVELEKAAEQLVFIISASKDEERRLKEAAQREELILKTTEECRKLLVPTVTAEQINSCLSPVITLDPNHHSIASLQNDAQALILIRMEKEREVKEYRDKVAQLQRMYDQAERVEKSGEILKAIQLYENVAQSGLPDPNSQKVMARQRIQALSSQIGSKSSVYKAEADKFAAEKNYKAAILKLRQARQINPQDSSLQVQIDRLVNELKKEMKILWEEAIIEESYGKVTGDDNNSGAVGKWKKILEQDIPEGEFYQKAATKLRKYGAL